MGWAATIMSLTTVTRGLYLLCAQTWTTIGATAPACLAASAASSLLVVLGVVSDYVNRQQKNGVINAVTNFRRHAVHTHETYYWLHDGDHTSVAKFIHTKDLLQMSYGIKHNLIHIGSGHLMTWNHDKSRLYRVQVITLSHDHKDSLSCCVDQDQAELQSLDCMGRYNGEDGGVYPVKADIDNMGQQVVNQIGSLGQYCGRIDGLNEGDYITTAWTVNAAETTMGTVLAPCDL